MLQDKELAIQSLQNEHVVLRSDYESVLDQLEQLKVVNKAICGQNKELTAEKDQAILEQQRTKESSHKSDIAYELFKSFVDTDSRKTLLIDTTYSVCYINRSAAALLQLSEPGVIIGRRLFDFFAYKDALKVKKKIDAAFFSGEKEKIKEVVFMNPRGGKTQIDLKMARVRYLDKPSIKMTIK